MNLKEIGFLLLTCYVASSCNKKTETVNPNTNCAYFPSNIGHETIYDVDSISKNDFTNTTDTFHFQIKEVIESAFTDNEGRPSLRLERYKRADPTQAWTIYKVLTANVTNVYVEKKEDNITYLKLAIPIALKKKWNGNAKNQIGEQEYEYTSVNEQANFGTFIFDSTLAVLHVDEDNFQNKKYEIEKFSTGLGMYYKESFFGEQNGNSEFVKFTYYTEKIISVKN